MDKKDPFYISGGELLKLKVGAHAKPHEETFVKPKKVEPAKSVVNVVSKPKAIIAPKPQPILKPEPDLEPYSFQKEEEKEPPKELVVHLSNPQWSVDRAQFTDVVTVSVDATYPDWYYKHFSMFFELIAI